MPKSKHFRWSPPMSQMLLLILADEAIKGNKPSSTFKSSSIARVAKEISESFVVECESKHVENHLQTIKSNWVTICTVTQKSGFNWDNNLKMATCPKPVYDDYVKKFPDHTQYLNKKIEMYDEMAIVVGKDMATGSFARSFIDIEAENTASERSIDMETQVDDSSTETSSKPSCKCSRATVKVHCDFSELSANLRTLSDAIKDTSKFCHVDELYEEIMKMEGFSDTMLASAYDFLVADQTMTKASVKKNDRLRRVWLENFFLNHRHLCSVFSRCWILDCLGVIRSTC